MKENIKLKISDITEDKNSNISKFSIAYSAKKMDNSQVSYQIISTLKAQTNIIIEVNSSLINASEYDIKYLLTELIEAFDTLGLQYVKKKISVSAKRTILSIARESKQVEGFECYVLIPDEIWRDPKIQEIIPNVGIRYYLPKTNFDDNLGNFMNLDDEEKYNLCKMVIFDHIYLGSMGINTSIYTKKDLQEIFTID